MWRHHASFGHVLVDVDSRSIVSNFDTTSIVALAAEPNRNIGQAIAELTIPNTNGFMINTIWIDFGEQARVTDVALGLAGNPPTGPEPAPCPTLRAYRNLNQMTFQIGFLPDIPVEIEQTTSLTPPAQWTPVSTNTAPCVFTCPFPSDRSIFWRAVMH